MSLRWKYLIVVHAALAATAAAFLALGKLSELFEGGPGIFVWAGALSLVLSIVLFAAYRSFLAGPLERLTEGAQRLAEGDDAARIPVRGGGELERLALAINEMAARIQQSRRELEAKVAERTEDLRSILVEVNERSRIHEEVNRQLAEADRRKTEFLTNVSHELRTPLNAILGFLRLIAEGLYETDDERAEFLDNAQLCGEHLKEILSDVLTVARLETGRESFVTESFDAGKLARETVRMLHRGLARPELDVVCEVEGAPWAQADEGKARQILVNLVGNAFKFTPEGGIRVRVTSGDGMVRFEVEDSGVGFPLEETERIFEKFHQVDMRSTRDHGGAGLGLAISKSFVERMGGTIGAHSDGPGKGARFHFELPLAAAAAPVP